MTSRPLFRHRPLAAAAVLECMRTGKIPPSDYAELVRAAGELQNAKLFIDHKFLSKHVQGFGWR